VRNVNGTAYYVPEGLYGVDLAPVRIGTVNGDKVEDLSAWVKDELGVNEVDFDLLKDNGSYDDYTTFLNEVKASLNKSNDIIEIEINHSFDIPEEAKNTFESIFDECMTHSCGKKSLVVKWRRVDMKEEKRLGSFGSNIFGNNPGKLGFYIRENNKQKSIGLHRVGGFNGAINMNKLKTQVSALGGNLNRVLGVTLAHEIGFHGIGDEYDWVFGTPTDWAGKGAANEFVDSKSPSVSKAKSFSKQACTEILDQLGIDLK